MTSDANHPIWPTSPLSLISLIPYAPFRTVSWAALHSYNAGDPGPTICDVNVLEHTADDQALRTNVFKDIDRTLKSGGPSHDCFDAFLRPAGQSWVNGLIPYLYADATLRNRFVPAKFLLDGCPKLLI